MLIVESIKISSTKPHENGFLYDFMAVLWIFSENNPNHFLNQAYKNHSAVLLYSRLKNRNRWYNPDGRMRHSLDYISMMHMFIFKREIY